jgi:hypothetical protein
MAVFVQKCKQGLKLMYSRTSAPVTLFSHCGGMLWRKLSLLAFVASMIDAPFFMRELLVSKSVRTAPCAPFERLYRNVARTSGQPNEKVKGRRKS